MSRFYSDLLDVVELDDEGEDELSDFFSVLVSAALLDSPESLLDSEEVSFFFPPFDFA